MAPAWGLTLVSIGLILARLIGWPRRLSVAYPRTRRRSTWTLIGILVRPLVRVLIRVLARILGRPLVGILVLLVLILRRAVGRGDLSILRIGRRSCRTPVTLLARRRCLLLLRSATKAGASTILAPSAPESTHCKRFLLFKSILKPPCPGETPDPSARTYCIDGSAHSPSQFLNPVLRQKLPRHTSWP